MTTVLDEISTRDEHVSALVEFAKAVNLEELVWERDGRRIAFKRRVDAVEAAPAPAPAPVAEAPAAPAAPASQPVLSPMVGTFWRAIDKDRPPLVLEGGRVTSGQRVAVVEAMKILKDVICSVNGRITKIYVENGKPVEYGQKLFEVEIEPA